MRLPAMLALLAASPPALASWPTDITLSGMRVYDGERAAEPVTDAYRELVEDLAVMVANQPILPASTTGESGWDITAGPTMLFTQKETDGEPTHWQRAAPDGDPPQHLFVSTVTARKGLPWSTEIGATGGWVGGSHQGVFGGFLRASLLEGYKPYPDVNVHLGYSAYVNNDELDLGVFDFGASIGSPFALKRWQGITFSFWEPFFDVSLLRVTAHHRLSDEVAEDVGIVDYGGTDADEGALALLRWGAGFQVRTSSALLRYSVAWAPASAPTMSMAIGFSL